MIPGLKFYHTILAHQKQLFGESILRNKSWTTSSPGHPKAKWRKSFIYIFSALWVVYCKKHLQLTSMNCRDLRSMMGGFKEKRIEKIQNLTKQWDFGNKKCLKAFMACNQTLNP